MSALIQPYFHHRDELTIEDGIIYKGDGCVIPATLRPELLRKLHGPHMGVEATLRWGRQLVYWPGMTSQLKDRCQRCDTCRSRGRAQQQESLECHEIPQYPWQVVGADFFRLNGRDFLVRVDCWSGYWELDKVTDLTTTTVKMHMRRQFARYGVPVRVITDNGPQFSFYEFQVFARLWNFCHITSSPYHPASKERQKVR